MPTPNPFSPTRSCQSNRHDTGIYHYHRYPLVIYLSDYVLVYLEGEKPPPPRHAEFRQTFLENLAKSQLEFEEVTIITFRRFIERDLNLLLIFKLGNLALPSSF